MVLDGARAHGFLRQKDGTFTSFDLPGSHNTFAQAINSDGRITGFSSSGACGLLACGDGHGFLRQENGAITSFDPPGSFGTIADAINSDGQITGWYFDAARAHGFLRQENLTLRRSIHLVHLTRSLWPLILMVRSRGIIRTRQAALTALCAVAATQTTGSANESREFVHVGAANNESSWVSLLSRVVDFDE